MELDISGKTAWICGATGAIGRATALALAAEGVTVALSARSEPGLRALAADVAAAHPGSRAVCLPLDITSRDEVDRAAASIIADCGGIDILVNTVALPIFGDFLALQDADWDAVFQAKHFGYMRTMRAVIPNMVAKGSGQIINVSGRGGHQPSSASHFAGSSANAAVNLLTKGLADLYARNGLRINAVAPGPVASDRYDRIAASNQSLADKARDGRRATNVAGLGQPDDIAAIILFLASKPSSHLNGIVVQADGGSTAAL